MRPICGNVRDRVALASTLPRHDVILNLAAETGRGNRCMRLPVRVGKPAGNRAAIRFAR